VELSPLHSTDSKEVLRNVFFLCRARKSFKALYINISVLFELNPQSKVVFFFIGVCVCVCVWHYIFPSENVHIPKLFPSDILQCLPATVKKF
jgi:hypothetical protein